MTTELLVIAVVFIAIALYIMWWQDREIKRRDDTLGEVERTLDAASKTVNLYQQILSDVAHNHATLEITDDGRIVATHFTDRKTSLH
jgi:LytS/YehU family sensor histidine kinase